MTERLLVLSILIVVVGIPAGITWSKGQRGVFSWIPPPRHGLGGCCLQTRSAIIVVGAPFLWSREDAAGAKSVRFRDIYDFLKYAQAST